MSRRQRVDPNRMAAYIRVSTDEQSASGAGLSAQRAAIETEAERRGWVLIEIFEDAGLSGKSMDRPALRAALNAVESGEAAGIVVAKLDRLSRSLLDFAALMQRAQQGGWNLVALDLGVDLASPAGEFLASVMASAAQWERRIISQRTKDALEAKRRDGQRLGRPSAIDVEILRRIAVERNAGRSFVAIAEGLTADGIATARGSASWSPSAVRKAFGSQAGRQFNALADGSSAEDRTRD